MVELNALGDSWAVWNPFTCRILADFWFIFGRKRSEVFLSSSVSSRNCSILSFFSYKTWSTLSCKGYCVLNLFKLTIVYELCLRRLGLKEHSFILSWSISFFSFSLLFTLMSASCTSLWVIFASLWALKLLALILDSPCVLLDCIYGLNGQFFFISSISNCALVISLYE